MADKTVQDQKPAKKVNFSEPRPPVVTNKNQSGPYRLQEGPQKGPPVEDWDSSQSPQDNHHSLNKSQAEEGYYKGAPKNKGQLQEGPFNRGPPRENYNNRSRGRYNKGPTNNVYNRNTSHSDDFTSEGFYNRNKSSNRASHLTEGSFHNQNRAPSSDTRFFNRNRTQSESEDKNMARSDFDNSYRGKNRHYIEDDQRVTNQSKDYESINRNRGNHSSRLQRSRSFGQSGVGKAMENFGVRDLRELLDRKQQIKGSEINCTEQESKKKIPPPDPGYNFLKDPLRENSEEKTTENEENEISNQPRNKNRPNRGVYQPNRNRNYENVPRITIKNNTQDKNEEKKPKSLKHKQQKHNVTSTETLKDLPNIKIELSVDNNSRKAEIDNVLKIAELKHFPDEGKRGGNSRGRGRGRGRGAYRGRGMGRGARKENIVKDESGERESLEDGSLEYEGVEEQFESEYTETANQNYEGIGEFDNSNINKETVIQKLEKDKAENDN